MWSPSGAVGRGELDNTCWPALPHFVCADVTPGPKAVTQTLLGLLQLPPSPSPGCPSSPQASSPSSQRKGGSGLEGREGFFPLQNAVLFGILHRREFLSGGLWWKPGCKMWCSHSIFLLAVPSGCLPSQDMQEWPLQLRRATWGCVTKTPAAIYHRPQCQSCSPAAGREKSPGQCVRIMWGLGRGHGLGMRQSLTLDQARGGQEGQQMAWKSTLP